MTGLKYGMLWRPDLVKLATCVKTDWLCWISEASSSILLLCFFGWISFSKGDKVLQLSISVVLLLIVAWLFRDFLWRRIAGRFSVLKLVTFVSLSGVNWVFYLILYLPWCWYLTVSWFLLPVFFLKGVIKPVF